jgi:4,5-dihydroxyphthalate decarboxylase
MMNKRLKEEPMEELRLSMACGPYDRTEALRGGQVTVKGVDLTYLPIQWPVEVFSRMLQKNEFDIAEMSLTHCFVLRAKNPFPFVTVPLFLSRLFRHGYIFVNRTSGIAAPKDLEGRRIGVQGYQMTAAVWIRGILQHEYGVSFDEVEWIEGGVNVPNTAGNDVTALRPVRPINIERAGEGTTLSAMLAAREIDAVIGAFVPDSLKTHPDVVRLFPDYRQTERDYFRRTGIFPIMHALVIKESLCRENPWLPEALYKACEQAKAWAQQQMRFSGSLRHMLPWLLQDVEEIDDLFGGDAWPYGVEANRRALEAFAQYLLDQGLMPESIALENIFASV